jgi:hypothetical protein
VFPESSGEPLCFTNNTVPELQSGDYCYFTIVLMFLIQLGAGLGGIAVLSHGLAYVDDNVEKGSSAALIGKTGHRFRAVAINSDSKTFLGRRTENTIIRVIDSDIEYFRLSRRFSANVP